MRKVAIEVKHTIEADVCLSIYTLLDDGDLISSEFVTTNPDEVAGDTKSQVIEFKKYAFLNPDGRIFLLENLLEPQPLEEFIEQQTSVIKLGFAEGRWAGDYSDGD